MNKKIIRNLIPLALLAVILFFGCTGVSGTSAPVVVRHSVTFHAGSVDVTGEMESLTYAEGEEFSIGTCAFSYDGWTFAGWSTSAESSVVEYEESAIFTMGNEDVHFYAIWENSAKSITAFSFTAAANAALDTDVSATINGTVITADVPYGTDVSSLVANFTFTGSSISLGNATQTSGTTANNFSSDLTYSVTAADGSLLHYTVSVTVALNSDKELTTFSFTATANAALDSDVSADIYGRSITATVPFGTDLTSLVATFTTTGSGVSLGNADQTSGTTSNNFTNSVSYTVTAADGSSQNYSVTVTAALNPAKELTAFSFTAMGNTTLYSDVSATINGTEITAEVPYGTDMSALIATFSTTGSSVSLGNVTQTSGITANNFTDAVIYSVNAQDNSVKNYTIRVNVAELTYGTTLRYPLGTIDINMQYCPGGTFPTGDDDSGSHSINDGFWVGETEVTHQLWYSVYTWATSGTGGATGEGEYIFANPGIPGHDGISGSETDSQEPVTTINWRDVMVFSNALTEYYNAIQSGNLICVYTSDASYTTPIRTSTDSSTITFTDGSQDDPFVNPDANGFRLPGMYEWECAARYIDGNSWTPGNYASGATAYISDETATRDVAVYSPFSGSSTAAVKSMTANALGCYDMSGNVLEWNFDWTPNNVGGSRVSHGGSWGNTAFYTKVGYSYNSSPYNEDNNTGFRLFMTAN